MSSVKNYVPRTAAKFLVWSKNLLAYVKLHHTRMKIYDPGDPVADMVSELELWVNKCDDPNHGSLDVSAKNLAHKKLEKELRAFVQGMLARNTNVTDLDREAMAIPVYDTIPTPVSEPRVRPKVNVLFKSAGSLQMQIAPEADISEDRRAYYGCKIQYELMHIDAPRPESRDVLNKSVFTRRKKEPFVFQPEDSGKKMYFCARYENSKGQAGPWSTIMGAVIP